MSATLDLPCVDRICEELKTLSRNELFRIELIARALQQSPKNRSATELEGLGQEIWNDIDPLQYVSELRKGEL